LVAGEKIDLHFWIYPKFEEGYFIDRTRKIRIVAAAWYCVCNRSGRRTSVSVL